MSEQINAYRNLFQDAVELELQARKPKLSPFVEMGSHAGQEKTRLILRAGRKNTKARTTRGNQMTFSDTALAQRWITGYAWDVNPDLLDNIDKVRMGVEPSSYIVKSHAAAIVRNTDQEIIGAIFGNAKIGDDGGSTVAFDTGNSIAAASSGMTVAKLRAAQRQLQENHVDIETEMPCLAMTPQQHDNLLADIHATSKDFNGGEPVLKNGRITDFMNFKFVVIASDAEASFGLPVDGSSNRRCPFWVKSGMHYGVWMPPTTSITQREDIQGRPYQVYSQGDHGATRLDEGKVGEILCAED